MGVLVVGVVQVEHELFQEDVVVLEGVVLAHAVAPGEDLVDGLRVEEWDAAGGEQGVPLQVDGHDNTGLLEVAD